MSRPVRPPCRTGAAAIAAALAVIGFLPGCRQSPDPARELAALMATDREFAAASVSMGAAAAFREYLLEDALQLPAGSQPLRGRENIYAEMLKAGDGYSLNWEPQEGQVAASGEFGFTWGTYTVEVANAGGSGGEPRRRTGKYLNVWKKDDRGRWRVLVDTGNSNE